MFKKAPRLILVFIFTLSMGLIVTQAQDDDDLTADELYDLAYEAYLDADYETAIEGFTNALELDNSLGDAYFYRALSDYNLGNADDNMLADLDSALNNDVSDRAWAYNIRGLTNARMENYEDAIVDYTEAVALSPTYRVVYENRASVYSTLDDWENVAEDRKTILELAPNIEGVYNNLAWAYIQLERYNEALDYVEVELENNSDLDYAIDTLGWALWGTGEYFDAIEAFERAIELGEEYSYYGLGVVFNSLGAQSTAIENLERYIDAYGEDAEQEAIDLLNELQGE